jgi:hypothetical protein
MTRELEGNHRGVSLLVRVRFGSDPVIWQINHHMPFLVLPPIINIYLNTNVSRHILVTRYIILETGISDLREYSGFVYKTCTLFKIRINHKFLPINYELHTIKIIPLGHVQWGNISLCLEVP